MNSTWLKLAAIAILGLLGAGTLWVVFGMVMADGKVTVQGDGGEIGLAFMLLREIVSHIHKIALSIKFDDGGAAADSP